MAFETLKRRLDSQKEAANAKLRRDQVLFNQRASADVTRQKSREQREATRTAQLRECFFSSHIHELTDELVKLIPEMEKIPAIPSNYYTEDSSFAKDYIYKETDSEDKKYFTIKLTWNKSHSQSQGSDNTYWSEIELGFLQDKSFVVDGKRLSGGFSKIPEEKWKKNPELVSNAIEKGYLHPRHESSTRLSDFPGTSG